MTGTGKINLLPKGQVVWSRPRASSTLPTCLEAASWSSISFLAVLHPVRAITVRPLATTPPLPSLPHAGIFASRVGQAVWEFPSSTARDVLVTRSCLLYTGRLGNNTRRSLRRRALRPPFWVGCLNHFHPSGLTMLTQVSYRQLRS
jgi:hypothetical protein